MNGKQVKLMRSQLRNIVDENIEEVLSEKLVAAIEKKVQVEVQRRLDILFEQHAFAMKQFDEKLKDVQGYMIRNSAQPNIQPTELATPPTPTDAA